MLMIILGAGFLVSGFVTISCLIVGSRASKCELQSQLSATDCQTQVSKIQFEFSVFHLLEREFICFGTNEFRHNSDRFYVVYRLGLYNKHNLKTYKKSKFANYARELC